ncbi:MAG: DUF4277 domain-containing protein [Cyanothece sp. SIO2G6]|nr:DUF4277 domain-containing protein [Cyanothece sp. SIO2G6]
MNDDRLGRVLDALYLGGLSEIFLACCMKAAQGVGLACQSVHLDEFVLRQWPLCIGRA